MATAPQDGRMTSFSSVPATLAGTELMWIVQPGNPSLGVLYNATLDTLAQFFAAFPQLNTAIVTSGATYNVLTTNTIVLFDKTLGSASACILPSAASMTYKQSVLIKDLKGDAATNPITITFTGGELCDGLNTLTINNPYGWFRITPVPTGGAWYMS